MRNELSCCGEKVTKVVNRWHSSRVGESNRLRGIVRIVYTHKTT